MESFEAFAKYRGNPAGFAREVLGSSWWQAQEQTAHLVARHRRVAVKAANGVGKTYLAADLVLWFLYCQSPSVVLTTAPTWRQVEALLWNEIRRRFQAVNGRRERAGLEPLPGTLLETRLKISEGHFAMGLSTDQPVRFQGFHAENLFVVLDEACGVPEEIWDAIEGICVGKNNRVLAISNPLRPSGHFYSLFRSPRWKTVTISAMEHPNVRGPVRRRGQRRIPVASIPGAVTRGAVADRIVAWCEEENEANVPEKGFCFRWEGKRYRPNSLFLSRVLGEFPEAAYNSLIERSWVERAMAKTGDTQEEETRCIVAVDVARFGSDETVVAVRHGGRVAPLHCFRGLDTMETAAKVREIAQSERAALVIVDEIGVGAGVLDRLREEVLTGVTGVSFSSRPVGEREASQFANLRAQTYWNLREYLRGDQIILPPEETLGTQLVAMRYLHTPEGRILIESKEEIRRHGQGSPDRADAVAMLFCPAALSVSVTAVYGADSLADAGRPMPIAWHQVGDW